MKKKLTKYFALLCVFACVFSLTACSEKKSSEITYTEETVEEIQEQLDASGSDYDFEEWLDSYADSFVSSLESDFVTADRDSLLETYADDEMYLEAAKSYLEATEEVGDYANEDAYNLNLEMSDNVLSLSGMLVFEKRDVNFVYTGDFSTGEASLSFEKELSFGEILEKAGMNTLLGMGSVFLVLILISFVIKCLGFFAVSPEKATVKQKATDAPAPAASTPAEVSAVTAAPAGIPDDVEMAIVIATAIAAAEEETGSDGYRVRSIKRAGNSKWRRA